MEREDQSSPRVSPRSRIIRQESPKGSAGISIIPPVNLENFVGIYTGEWKNWIKRKVLRKGMAS